MRRTFSLFLLPLLLTACLFESDDDGVIDLTAVDVPVPDFGFFVCEDDTVQGNYNNLPFEISANFSGGQSVPEKFAQSFTPTRSGYLESVYVIIYQVQGAELSNPMSLELRGDCTGKPCANVVGTSSAIALSTRAIGDLFSPVSYTKFDFSSNTPAVMAGVKYWWVGSAAVFGEMVRIYASAGDALAGQSTKADYGSGTWPGSYGAADFAFKTHICGD